MQAMKTQTRTTLVLLTATAALAITTLPIRAQEESSDDWRFGVAVPLWAPRVDGNVTVKGVQQDVNVDFDKVKDHLDASFSLAVDAHKGDFGMFSSIGYMKFSGGYSGPQGGHANSELKLVIVNAGLSLLLIKTGGDHPFLLAGTAGLRYWYASEDLSISDATGNQILSGGEHKDLYDPVIGLRASQFLTPRFHLDFMGDIGGFNISYDHDFTWSASGLATYDITRWFSLSAGYSGLHLDVKNGSGSSQNGFNLTFSGPQIVAKFTF